MQKSADLVIVGGTLVTPSAMVRASLAIRDGKISEITSAEAAPRAARTIEAEGLYVLPGIIDVHVHLREPGLTYKEDFASGTAAAAAGGVTCVFDMPNTIPPTTDAAALREKIGIARSKAVVDFALYGMMTRGNLGRLRGMARAGAVGFKCYMAETTGRNPPPSNGEMLEQFSEAYRLDRRVAVHAENDSIVRYLVEKLRSEGRVGPRAHYESRPEVAEEEAVERALLYSRRSGCRLHVAHLSSAGGVREVREAKARRQQVTAETAPHYLLLDDRKYGTLGSLMKINPSVKTARDRAALWRGLRDGTVDMIASDHSPHTIEEKTQEVIFDAPSGFPGLETSVPLMLTQVNRGRLTLTSYARLSSENPARAWGLFPRKGSLEVGSDADLTIVDMKASARVDASRFYSKAGWSPFDGAPVRGLPVYTVSRGRVVMDHGAVDAHPWGRLARPEN